MWICFSSSSCSESVEEVTGWGGEEADIEDKELMNKRLGVVEVEIVELWEAVGLGKIGVVELE
jgi:hypothetical protein